MLRSTQTWLACSRLGHKLPCLSCPTELRRLTTLAIESSCDDTSVAILERVHPQQSTPSNSDGTRIHFHEKITADNQAYGGIHPVVSLASHQSNLAKLVDRALRCLPTCDTTDSGVRLTERGQNDALTSDNHDGGSFMAKIPDFVSVTRGPGMRSNLSVGLEFAKGLSVAWQRPLLGVHHMQAHALTPRLASALHVKDQTRIKPNFPFLSLLVSGGHTLLLHSHSLISHTTLATTTDIAIGDAIDKVARVVLPSTMIAGSISTMFGPILERFAFPHGTTDYENYEAPMTRHQEITRRVTRWGWGFTPPLAATRGGSQNNSMQYSFSGIWSTAAQLLEKKLSEGGEVSSVSLDERRDMAREAMRVAFEHLASRVIMAMNDMKETDHNLADSIRTLVVSGGVAANGFLKKVLRSCLDVRGYGHVELVFPPVELCTDNAAMIAWAGMEMFEAGYKTDLGCQPLRKWSMDPNAEDGGILGVGGWEKKGEEK